MDRSLVTLVFSQLGEAVSFLNGHFYMAAPESDSLIPSNDLPKSVNWK